MAGPLMRAMQPVAGEMTGGLLPQDDAAGLQTMAGIAAAAETAEADSGL